MSAIDPRSTPDTYFINGRNISGSAGDLYGRACEPAAGSLVSLGRLAVRLRTQLTHYDELCGYFERKKAFGFEIHRGLHVRLSVTAVISELVRNADAVSCLVEFDLL